MTDEQKPRGEEAVAFPGLQLLGDDTAMGACVDGVCAMPHTQIADPVATKRD